MSLLKDTPDSIIKSTDVTETIMLTKKDYDYISGEIWEFEKKVDSWAKFTKSSDPKLSKELQALSESIEKTRKSIR